MEVHHHPDLNHKNKNFKEYFLEFLMIFLAVTMGFFAENIREYFSNNEIVTQLTQQLVQELKKDTVNLNQSIVDQTNYRKKADSVFYMLRKPLDQIEGQIFATILDVKLSVGRFLSVAGDVLFNSG